MATSTTSATAETINYETKVFDLKPDSFGPNRATLLHGRTTRVDQNFYKAILYIHGYNDYFFQDHVCQQFLDHGYDFFGLDLRKCGRSIIFPSQEHYKHYFNGISEYNEEITLSIEYMLQQAKGRKKKLILYGHSTGGLITSLYASEGAKREDIDAVILNSPFLVPLETSMTESLLLSIATRLGVSSDIDDNWYGRSIHSSCRGEWSFDSKIKPIDKIRVHGSSFSAIRRAQEKLAQKGSCISCPILFLSSNRSIKPEKNWRDEYGDVDLILNVMTMKCAAANLGPQVTLIEVENGKHDVFLSNKPVREKAFSSMFRWLKHLEEDWRSSTEMS